MIDAFEIDLYLNYDPIAGVLTWKSSGAQAFTSIDSGGYPHGSLCGFYVRAHQVAWAFVKGYWPLEIDHRNGDRADYRIDNLRDVPHSVNSRNMRRRSRIRELPNGVRFHKGKFHAHIRVGGRQKHLGVFTSADLAHNARLEANRQFGFTEQHCIQS